MAKANSDSIDKKKDYNANSKNRTNEQKLVTKIKPSILSVSIAIALLSFLVFFLFNKPTSTPLNTKNSGKIRTKKEKADVPKGANAEGKPIEVVQDVCQDRHKECKQFFKAGECQKTPGWYC